MLDDQLGTALAAVLVDVQPVGDVDLARPGVPALAVRVEGDRVDVEVSPGQPQQQLQVAVADAAPLHRFRLWPLGLFEFLEPVLAANPYADAVRWVELLDEDALLESCRALLFDEAPAASLREAQARYRERVRALPGPAQAFRSVIR